LISAEFKIGKNHRTEGAAIRATRLLAEILRRRKLVNKRLTAPSDKAFLPSSLLDKGILGGLIRAGREPIFSSPTMIFCCGSGRYFRVWSSGVLPSEFWYSPFAVRRSPLAARRVPSIVLVVVLVVEVIGSVF